MDGPSQGEVYPISKAVISLGRHHSNDISVPDPSVSRQHCRLLAGRGGKFRVADNDSRNGTFVNDLPIEQRDLQHNDVIRLGKCRFLFLTLVEETEERPSTIMSESIGMETRTIVSLDRADAVYLRPEEALAAGRPSANLARNLTALMQAATAVRAARGVAELARELMRVVFDVTPAGVGALLLLEPGLEDPVWSLGWQRDTGEATDIPVAAPLALRAFREDIAILSNESSDAGSEPPPSRLVAPLAGSGESHGVLYLSAPEPRVRFTEDHLQILTAIAALAAPALEIAIEYDRLRDENRRLREEIDIKHDMVGESPRMQTVLRFVAKVAPAQATVLINGESGTGKELVARAIHRNSPRASHPFVAINCAALTQTLLESELFGHEKGAFTGAVALKKGKLEVADSGTVFLDEIGEVPPAIQVKLLRAIQEREFERVGGTRPVRVDVRVVAATNRDLKAAIAAGKFREDLYYRLNVVSIDLPPLRERKKDIPLLAAHFANKYGARLGRALSGISPEARARLIQYDWPGNVRELENAIERAAVLGSGERILPEDLPEVLLEAPAPKATQEAGFHEAVRQAKRQILIEAIEQTGGSQTGAARALGINPTYLSRLIRNLDLKDHIKRTS